MFSKFAQVSTRNPKVSPATAGSYRQILKNCGECLWRDVSTGIIYAIIKRTILGKKKQFKKSLGTTDLRDAGHKLAEFRSGLNSPPSDGTHPGTLMRSAFRPAPPESLLPNRLAGKSFMVVGDAWLATQHNLRQSTVRRRRYSIQVVAKGIGGESVAGISRLECEHWATRHAARVSSRTVNMDIESLKRVMGYAVLHGVPDCRKKETGGSDGA